MTVIASFFLNKIPFVVSDALTSGIERPSLTLPTSGPIVNLPPSNVSPTDLLQKLVIISPEFALAFAGDVNRVVRIFGAVRKLNRRTPITPEVWRQFLADKEPMLEDVCLLGFIMMKQPDGSYIAHQISYRAELVNHAVLGPVLIAGTGTKHLLRAADDSAEFSNFGAFNGAIARVLTMFGYLLRDEHATGSPITQASSGGAYELAVFGSSGFKKITGITYVFWQIDVIDGDVIMLAPHLILKQIYAKEALVINCARWDGKSSWHGPGPLKYELSAHAIYPPYKLPSVPLLPTTASVGFESPITVQCMLVAAQQESHILHVVTMGAPGFTLKFDGKGEMTMPAELIEDIRSVVLQNLAAQSEPTQA